MLAVFAGWSDQFAHYLEGLLGLDPDYVLAVLRIIFTLVVQQLFDLPWLKLVGGLILLWIAVKLLLGEEAQEDGVKSGANVWEALKIVAIADIVMSLDNVLRSE